MDIPLGTVLPLAVQAIQQKMDKFGDGQRKELQYFVFTDSRTGTPDEAHPFLVANSGFELSFKYFKKDGKYFTHVQRTAVETHGAKKGVVF